MAETATVPIRPPSTTARQSVQRAARNYSFGFAALLAVALLIGNIATEHGGFGLTDQLANVAPLAIAALASAPSIIGGGFDLSSLRVAVTGAADIPVELIRRVHEELPFSTIITG